MTKDQIIIFEHLKETTLQNRSQSIFFTLNDFHKNILVGFGYTVILDTYRKLSIKEQYEILKEVAAHLLDHHNMTWIELNRKQEVVYTYLTETAIEMNKKPFFAIMELCEIVTTEYKKKRVVNAFNKLSQKEQYEVLGVFADFELAVNRIDWET
ncbi:hypothetical protein [Enterococcus sp. BWR-S5]|uniref:hypothetical protein n=1 Tax=Enterococcus sp. BWR-S5 TaxID=2787714 RepID=UPI0019241B0E|nr:hypothetical protein [Enterococcus sp. BWR-S5]MBL1227256.1 hypothetical protein [Enterococcus sp. BWR-S5]